MTTYGISDDRIEDLSMIFTFHPVHGDQVERYEHIRSAVHEVVLDICAMTPPGREQSVAITRLQEAVMWANAAIAIGEAKP